MKTSVKYIPCLFDSGTWIRFESHNQTVLSILTSLFQRYPEVRDDPPNITVRVNGKILHPLKWGKPLKDGDDVLVIQEVGGEAIVAIGAALGLWGSGAAGLFGMTLAATINVALFVVTVAYSIYSYATAPSAPKTGRGLNSSPTYGWDGLQMQVRQGVPVPIVYGEHLLGGNLIEAYISSVADKNYLNLLIALSEGPIAGIMKEDLTGVCTVLPVSAVGTITMSEEEPVFDEPFTIDTSVFRWALSREGSGKFWVTKGANGAENVANIIAAVSADMNTVFATKGAGNTVTITALGGGVIGNSMVFTESTTGMTMDGGGFLGGTVSGSDGDHPHILINDNLLSNFKGITWDYRLGTHNQTQIPGFGNICQTYSMAGVKLTNTPYLYTTVDSDVEAFELRFRIPALFAQWKGNYYPITTACTIEHKLHSGSTWINDGVFSVTASSQEPIRRFFRIDNLTAGQYDIRITRTAATWVPSNPGWIEAIYLDNITEIKYDTLTYPFTALVAIKVLATEQLSGQIPNVLTRVRGRKVLNLDTSAVEWTRNPIYNINDLMVNSRYGTGRFITQANINNDQLILMADHCDEIVGDGTKRGIDHVTSTSIQDHDYVFVTADIGKYICCNSVADSTVFTKMLITSLTGSDKVNGTGGWSAGTPAETYWEWGEKRNELDLVIDASNPAFDCIAQICGSFRAVPIWHKDAIQLLIDKKESPSYIFNMGNILEGSFRHSFGSEKSKPNNIEVDYAGRDRKFQKETVNITDFASITGGVPKRTRRLSLLGASRQSQVYREARYHLNSPKYQDEQISLKGAIDAIHMLPGDIVKFQHDVFQWGVGGRVVSATTTAVTLDQPVTIGAGTYVITCKLANDTLETRTISNGVGTYTTVNVTVAFTTAPPAFGLYAVGLTGVEAKPFRIMQISKTPENEIEVVATEYNDLVYADTDIVITQPVYSPLPPDGEFPSPPDVINPLLVPPDVTGFDVTETTDFTGVRITFVRPLTTTNWAKANIYISRDGGTNYEYITTMYDIGPFIYRDVVAGTTYWFKAVSVSLYNIEGATPQLDSLLIVGTAAIGITSLTATVTGRTVLLQWVTAADTTVYKTEVWRAATNDRDEPDPHADLIASVYGTSYTDIISTYSTTVYYWVRNKNPNGGYSAWYPVSSTGGVSVTTEAEGAMDTTPPDTPTGLGLTTGIALGADGTEYSWIRANWTDNSESDLSHYEYRAKETGGNYIYGFVTASDVLLSPVRSNILHYVGIRAIDKSGNKSAFCSDETITSSKDTTLPAIPTSFAAVSSFKTIFLTWVNPTDKDFSHINIYRGTTSTRGSASLIAKVRGTFYADDIGTYPTKRYYWIASEDWSGNISETEAGPVNATTAQIATADIGTFAVAASQIYTNIPIITGDTWTDHSPSALYVAWNAHKLYYDGVEYSISASNTNLKYIYWVNGASSYTKSDTNPVLADGDFIIAVNISGDHDLAWNAIANQVIGSAYIQDLAVVNAKIGLLAVDDANINTLNASKINAGDIAAARMQVQGGNAINAGSVNIDPGKILISGATTLSDWRHGTDATKIDGGDIYANSITANKIAVGSRNLSIQGIEISANKPTANTLYWTAGVISYIGDDGVSIDASISASNVLWTTGTLYLYWVKAATSLSTTTTRATAFGAENIVLASYRGGTDLVVNYGRTIIDGSDIVTGTLTGDRLVANTIQSGQLYTGELITLSAQIKNAIIGTSKIGDLQVSTLKIASNAVTVPTYQMIAGFILGNGSFQEVAGPLYITNPSTTDTITVFILFSAIIGYALGIRTVACQIRKNNWPLIESGDIAGDYACTFAMGAGDVIPPSTTYEYDVTWYGADNTVGIRSRSLFAMGVKR